MKVYLDNAATTPLDKEVLGAMLPSLELDFGNPSSIHSFGRKTRSAIENSRKTIAKLLNVTPAEVFFTSGGTEADNMAIVRSIETYGIKHVISSEIEHHAVEHTLKVLESQGKIKVSWVRVDEKGNVDLNQIEELLKSNEKSLVSLMHANNELGTLLPLNEVGALCEKYDAIFHSDTVQTMGHYPMDLKAMKVHFATCAAHKFHGPKGVGFLYISNSIKIAPFIYGGSQERNMRGGTENVAGIVGLAKALELCYRDMAAHQNHIQSIFVDLNTEAAKADMAVFMEKYGMLFRTFGHGAFHGILSAIFFGLPLIGISALFERKSFKYIFIHLFYFIICFALMGGILCQFMK